MKNIHQDIIIIGAAKEEGRAPSHDGEYLTVFYVPGEEDYIVESNGGVAWTSFNESDVLSDCDDEDRPELQSQIDVANLIISKNTGMPATSMGSYAKDIAVEWGWATLQNFDSNNIIPVVPLAKATLCDLTDRTCQCGKNLEMHDIDTLESIAWLSCPEYQSSDDEHTSYSVPLSDTGEALGK